MAHSIQTKLRGLVAAFVAVFAALAFVPGTAFASPMGGNSLTITNLADGDQVTIYQVVQTDIDDQNVATNKFVTDFGVNFSDWTQANTAEDPDTSADVEGYASTIATYVNGHNGEWGTDDGDHTMYGPETADNGSVTFTNIEAGQYLVVVTSADDATRVYQNTIVSVLLGTDDNGDYAVNTNASADLKYTDMDTDDDGSVVDKTINGQNSVDNVDANDTVHFSITAPIPRYVANFDSRTFTLSDTMDDGFVYAGNLVVRANGQELDLTEDYELGSTDGFFRSIKLTPSALQEFAGQTLTVTYDAKLASGENAPVYNVAENNNVVLTFSVNSNDLSTKTAEDSVFMVVYGAKFTKVAVDDNETVLPGAEFKIVDASGETIATGTSDADGVVSIDGALAAGQQYTLVETSAPAGYQPIDDMTFTIASDENWQTTKTGYQYEINGGTIEDEPSNFFTELPTTGGPGTVALTAVGVVLVAGAAAFIVRSRKQD